MEREERKRIVQDLKTAIARLDTIDAQLANAKKIQEDYDKEKSKYGQAEKAYSKHKDDSDEERLYERYINDPEVVQKYEKEYRDFERRCKDELSSNKRSALGWGGLALVLAIPIWMIAILNQADLSAQPGLFVPFLVTTGLVCCYPIYRMVRSISEAIGSKPVESESTYVERRCRALAKDSFEHYQEVRFDLKKATSAFQSAQATYDPEMERITAELRSCRTAVSEIFTSYDIPETFQDKPAIQYICTCFENSAVDSFKEAYNRLMDKQEDDARNRARMQAEECDRMIRQMTEKWDREDRARREEEHRRNVEYEARRQADSATRAANALEEMKRKLDN